MIIPTNPLVEHREKLSLSIVAISNSESLNGYSDDEEKFSPERSPPTLGAMIKTVEIGV